MIQAIVDPILGITYEEWCPACKIIYRGGANASCPLCASEQQPVAKGNPKRGHGDSGEGNPERNEEMIGLLGEGASLRQVGRRYGLSREGVRYIRDKWGKAHGKE